MGRRGAHANRGLGNEHDRRRGRSPLPRTTVAWYAISPEDVAARLAVDPGQGLSSEEVERRLAQYGPNQLTTEPPPSLWSVALGQMSNPMNIMLAIVAVASIAIGQVATGIFVALLVTFNVVMGSRQELKARASVDALAQLQVPHARVLRSGSVEAVESVNLVPGDVVLLEAGDVVPADGRVVVSATLELQEAALTGESAPVAEGPRDARRRATSRSATAPTSCSRTRRSRAARRASS